MSKAKDVASTGSCFLAGVLYLGWSLGGLVLHLYTTLILLRAHGPVLAVLGFLLPGVAEMYTLGIMSRVHDTWVNSYTLYCSLWVAAAGLSYAIAAASQRLGHHEAEPDAPASDQILNDVEAKSVEITADFGEVYADLTEERLLFKPETRLPASREDVLHAMKISFQRGYPLPDGLTESYRTCYPQVAFFVSDRDFRRAQSYFDRLQEALLELPYHAAVLDCRVAHTNAVSAPRLALMTERFPGQSQSGQELVAEMDEFFEQKFLAGAPDDEDREWVRHLARTCWLEQRRLIRDWKGFEELVSMGTTGLEPNEVAQLRIKQNELKREIDSKIVSLGPAE